MDTSPSSEDLVTCRLSITQQNTPKRRNSDQQHDAVNNGEILEKRGCTTKTTSLLCPLANYGCDTVLSSDRLVEHYMSESHQKILMKVIEAFAHQLHNPPYCSETESDLTSQKHSHMFDTIQMLAKSVSCIHGDTAQVHTNIVQLQNYIMDQQKQISQLQQSIEETSEIFKMTHTNSNILQNQVESIKQIVTDSSSLSSNDGSYIWKITNFAEHRANAISDRQTSIYSPAFYSSPTGYKMCMRLYLNGDGNARRTHLSLFFVLLRGDYDPLLTWPFSYKVTFCLYDQSGNQRHIIDSFRPDTNSTSFQQPKSNMNVASGIPKFFPLSILEQTSNAYLRDDCMFIRCMVDFDSVPKSCVPYMTTINPALPLTIQKQMLQKEIDQRLRATEVKVEESEKSDTLNESRS